MHDVVLAPPKLGKGPRRRRRRERFGFKAGHGDGVVGLKRRAELSEARERVVERYRALMKGKGKESAEAVGSS